MSVATLSPTEMVRKTSWVIAHGAGNLDRAMARWWFVETFISANISASAVTTIEASSISRMYQLLCLQLETDEFVETRIIKVKRCIYPPRAWQGFIYPAIAINRLPTSL